VVPANREEGTAGGGVGGEGNVLGVRGRIGVAAVQGGPLLVRNAECLGEVRDLGGPFGVGEEGGVGAVEDPEERVCGGDNGTPLPLKSQSTPGNTSPNLPGRYNVSCRKRLVILAPADRQNLALSCV
jgi:hypothetical protein